MRDTNTFGYEKPLQDGIAKAVSGALAKPNAADQLQQLLTTTFGFIDTVTEDISDKQPPPKPLACSAGCSHCCHGFEVHVSPLEVLAIAEYIVLNMDVHAIRDILVSVVETQKTKNGHTPDEVPRASFLCPLNKENRCQVYAVRPVSCRGFNSFDARSCERRKIQNDHTVKIEGYLHPRRISDSVHIGFQLGFLDRKLDGHPLDLTPALLIALTNPDAKTQWLTGDPVFKDAYAQL
jgi:Fe-S-cluster containining protein